MRRFVDACAGLVTLAFVGGLGWIQLGKMSDARDIAQVSDEVRRFELEIKLRAAAPDGARLTGRGWPQTVDPAWFKGDPPRNTLLSSDRPWVEVASAEQSHLLHPPVRIGTTSDIAGFWYNPYQGVLRARVPFTVSDEEAIRLYNRLNGTELASIFASWEELKPPTPREPPADALASDEAPASPPIRTEANADIP